MTMLQAGGIEGQGELRDRGNWGAKSPASVTTTKSVQCACAYKHVFTVVQRGYSVESLKAMGAYISKSDWSKSDSEGFVTGGKSKCRLVGSSPTCWHLFSNKGADEHVVWSSHLSLQWEELLQSKLFLSLRGVTISSAYWYACGKLASPRCCWNWCSLVAETHVKLSWMLFKYTMIPIMAPPCRHNCLGCKVDGDRATDW